ncbi:LytTR family transcriptional regulator DNA-binding domain-containing protein [Paenibacillus cremeus]|uniref:LytTR family transcriptional regulator n=1 Tax=Paenibacillus cremeus TaxID=2163881 RepID=A0A559KCR2_9BACL|nr:LytTR family transcriptional regulator DNA-binding domain-containing protein [Paenibacillus cremeus]TVY09893.1 LytTR family transcriptional regulator [Paenibacillus cremeus]
MMTGDNLVLLNIRSSILEIVNKSDIIMIETELGEKGVIFITATDRYKIANTIEQWSDILFFDNFRQTDRNNILNLHQIESMDENGNVNFYDNKELLGSVARIHEDYIKFTLKRIKFGASIKESDYEFAQQSRNKKGITKILASIIKRLSHDEKNLRATKI